MSEEVISSEPVVSDSTHQEASHETPETPSSEGEELVSEGVESAADEVEAAPQLHRLTIDGEDFELTMDQVIEYAQKGKASVKRFQEAAALRKEAEAERAAIQAALHGKPEDLFEMKIKNGLMSGEDLEKWIIQKAIEIADRPEMTPEQQKMLEMERELEELRQSKEAEEKAKQEAAFQAEVEQHRENFSTQIMGEIESGGLEADPFTVQQVASVLMDSIDERGEITISVKDAVDYIKDQERNSYKEYLKSLDADKLERLLGEEILGQLRAKDLQKIKNPIAKPSNPFKSAESKSEVKKISASEFFKNL